jgi:hypothetical protein
VHLYSSTVLLAAAVSIAELSTPGATAVAQATAQIRVVHALAGEPPVDVWIDGSRLVGGLEFGKDTGYALLPAGAHTLGLVAAGGTVTEPLFSRDLLLVAGYPYTMIGMAAPAESLVLADESLAPVGGPAIVRFVHAAPDSPPMDFAVATGAVLARHTAFGEASPYVDVPGGTLHLVARLADTQTVVAGIPDATLTADRAYTFIVVGRTGGMPGIMLLPLVDATSPIVFAGYQ